MNAAELAAMTAAERQALVETLTELPDGQWQAASLCDGWRVIDVAAHLAWAPVMGVGEGAVALARHRFSANAMIAGTAIAWSGRGREAILAQLRDNARTGAGPIGMPPVAVLADAVVHGLDVRRALGLEHAVPVAALPPLADFALRTPWPLNVTVGGSARRRVSGLRLVATDADWTHGSGPEVHGRAEAMLMLLYGRRTRPDELSGVGADTLRSRF